MQRIKTIGEVTTRSLSLADVVWVDPERLSGKPCFKNTRVPIQTLWDHLEAGDTLETFLEDFEGVTREQAVAVLELARAGLFEALALR
jgi:uncharacterized protein (DUF433 family)